MTGTHHSFADVPLVRYGLARTPARRFAERLLVAAGLEDPASTAPGDATRCWRSVCIHFDPNGTAISASAAWSVWRSGAMPS
jgi:hypothetical protein